MKKLLAMFLLMPSLAFANTIAELNTICIDSAELTATVNEFEELPFVRGLGKSLSDATADPISIVVFANAKTGTFTIVQRQSSNLYCVLAVGDKFEPVPKKIQDDVKEQQKKGKL
jgi:hypothetical protein